MTRSEVMRRLERHEHARAFVAAAFDINRAADVYITLCDSLVAKAVVGKRRGKPLLPKDDEDAVRALLRELEGAPVDQRACSTTSQPSSPLSPPSSSRSRGAP